MNSEKKIICKKCKKEVRSVESSTWLCLLCFKDEFSNLNKRLKHCMKLNKIRK